MRCRFELFVSFLCAPLAAEAKSVRATLSAKTMIRLGVLLLAGASAIMDATTVPADKVGALLAVAVAATSCDAQQVAFNGIGNLGCGAVPSLASFAADRRPLPRAQMSLRNKARESFEGVRHYSPAVVGDAVQALLNQLTGKHFGPVYNGSTEQELTASAGQWQSYAAKTQTRVYALRQLQPNSAGAAGAAKAPRC